MRNFLGEIFAMLSQDETSWRKHNIVINSQAKHCDEIVIELKLCGKIVFARVNKFGFD